MYPKEESTYTQTIEKSKFITYLKPCFSEDEYKEYLKTIKKKHYDASHVCSAFLSDSIERSNDDGEPSGTAGVPMMNALKKNGINNAVALVVRYFGGIKLGAGGLIRAYGSSVSECIKNSHFVDDINYNKYELKLSYEQANKINYLLSKETVNLVTDYDEEVTFTFLTNDNKLIDKIIEITSGIKPKLIGEEKVKVDIL